MKVVTTHGQEITADKVRGMNFYNVPLTTGIWGPEALDALAAFSSKLATKLRKKAAKQAAKIEAAKIESGDW